MLNNLFWQEIEAILLFIYSLLSLKITYFKTSNNLPYNYKSSVDIY